jgi:hypothetical protein
MIYYDIMTDLENGISFLFLSEMKENKNDVKS